jgi:ferredoxin-like protein FixX
VVSQPRPTIQHCPLCGVAMLGSKSDANSPRFDNFTCLECGTVISYTKSAPKPKPDR